jgi:uncharacterized protein YgbK (DUF1537 family)
LAQRWLILADDLSGAADAGVGFARRGLSAEVRWTSGRAPAPDSDVIAFDTDSRRLDAAAAAAAQRAAVQALWAPGAALYKKIDSTLRGQPAAEISALAECTNAARVVFAPANPPMGRTTRDGRVWVDGSPLEDSEAWRREHSYETADLAGILATAGLTTVKLPLEVVRMPDRLAGALRARYAPRAVLVCDAERDSDLAAIAIAASDAHDTLFAGSAGLAQALAAQLPARRFSPLDLRPTRAGMLLVVGSLASISRVAAARVATLPGVRAMRVTSGALLDPDASERLRFGAAVAAALAAGEDVLVELAPESAPELARGPELARALARCLEPARHQVGGLAVTGGETASALLGGWYFHGIRLIEEVLPGITLGIALGESRVPLVTKPGGFGDASSLARALAALRRLKVRTSSG